MFDLYNQKLQLIITKIYSVVRGEFKENIEYIIIKYLMVTKNNDKYKLTIHVFFS